MIGRPLGIFGTYYMIVLCGHKSSINFKQLCFIAFAGLIRGAIAFALVLKLDENYVPEKNVIVTTTLILVALTTVIFGTIMPLVQRCLAPPE